MKNTVEFLDTIVSEWEIEAKEEDNKYFYYTKETGSIIKGKKSMVIGRKGEGKTAIASYIYKNFNSGNSLSERLSFKNFPFNSLYSLSDGQYTKPNQYITFWKYLIYVSICKQMINNTNIDKRVRNKLQKIFPSKNQGLKHLIKKITFKEFGLQILSTGLNTGWEVKSDNLSWIEVVDILEETILDNISDKTNHYIIFDELDEDYRDFTSSDEKKDYFDLITGLFKAVHETKTLFKENELPVFPIVFLRSDIFERITYSDKNKWSDSIIDLNWDKDKLRELIKYRIDVLTSSSSRNFSEAWIKIITKRKISMGNKQDKQMDSFDYILRSTHNRPRDLIKFIKVSARLANTRKHKYMFVEDIKDADSEFSEYMKKEIIDEIYSVLPEYDEIFEILSRIRKQTFQPREFVDLYNEKVAQKIIIDRGAEAVLKLLFDFSVIGNVPAMRSQRIFKYENESARFNFKENIIVHRGLYKALQIF